MGNTIPTEKIKYMVTEISEASNFNENLLKNLFAGLLALTGTEIKSNDEITQVFSDSLLSLKDESIFQFTQNVIDYLSIQIMQNINQMKPSLDMLSVIIETAMLKIKSSKSSTVSPLNDIWTITLKIISAQCEINEKTIAKDEMIKQIKNSFPLNIFIFCIAMWTNDDFFSKENYFTSKTEKFEISYQLVSIIYTIIYSKCNEEEKSVDMSYIDGIKMFVSCEKIFPKFKIQEMISKLFFNVFSHFQNILNYQSEEKVNFNSYENYFRMNVALLLWFCYDNNKFLIRQKVKCIMKEDNAEKDKENEFNRNVLKISLCLLFPNIEKISEAVVGYNAMYKDSLTNLIFYNVHLFKKVYSDFFSGYERFNYQFKISMKTFFIFLFESNMDFCEMVCLSKDYLHLMLSKLTFYDLFDLFLLNKLTLSKNFYIMMRHLDDDEAQGDLTNFNPQLKVQQICCKCLETALTKRKSTSKLDSISYYLLLVAFNVSLYLTEINQPILFTLSEYLTLCYEMELSVEKMLDNLINITLYYEIIVNFLKHLETPSYLVLLLLKLNDLMAVTYEKYSIFYTGKFSNDEKTAKAWGNYSMYYKKVSSILSTIKERIAEEGSDVRLTQCSEVIKIINKIAIEAMIFEEPKRETRIFNSEAEKFLILTIHMYENHTSKILK